VAGARGAGDPPAWEVSDWNDPESGPAAPGRFIALRVRSGSSHSIDRGPKLNSTGSEPSGGARTGPVGAPPGVEVATLGGGCFCCTEAVFSDLRGVVEVLPGYSGGHLPHPMYEQVCEGTTGHAEVVQVTFDPRVVSYHDLLSIFFTVHDPTTRNRQGNDVGTQYRSVIFVHTPTQERIAREVIAEVETARIWKGRIVTEIATFEVFYPAEAYHRDYFRRNPERAYCQAIIAPKVAKFRKHFSDRLRVPLP
jgi:peptide-methionine (S)-S-oxide reductase